MKRIYIFLFLFFLPPSVLRSQQTNISARTYDLWKKFKTEIQSLPIVVPDCPLSTLRRMPLQQREVDFWLKEIAKMRASGAADCCFQLLDELEGAAKNNPQNYALWLAEKTYLQLSFEKKKEAAVTCNQLTAWAVETGHGMSLAKLNTARIARAKRQFAEAMQNAEEALKLARSEKNKALEGAILYVIGLTSRDIYMERPEKNVPFLEQALTIATELRDTSLMLNQLTGIAISYFYNNSKELNKAFPVLERAFSLINATTSIRDRMIVVSAYGSILLENHEFDKALAVYFVSVELAKKLGGLSKIQNDYEHLADVYEGKHNYARALAMMDSAKVYCDFDRELGFFYNTYARLYALSGNLPLSVEYHQKAFEAQVKGYTNRNAALLTETETRMRTHEKELELRQQLTQRWFLVGIAGLAILLLSGALWAYWRNRKQLALLTEKNKLIEKQEAELRQLDAAKTRFFANVSHELRTPLTLILGPLSHLLKSNELTNHQFTLLSFVRQNAKSLLQLTNEILDLNKLEAGKMSLNEEPTVLYPLMRRLIANFESHAERQNTRLTFDYQPDHYLQIELDANKFEKIINNLLSNALKFTPTGGAIVVSIFEKPNAVELHVKDTGRGIHPDDLPQVFNRFYQSNQPDTPTEGGTGIGLSLSMEFAKLMHGKLWVESIFGQGSTFFFSFPKREVMGTGELKVQNEDLEIIEDTPSVSNQPTNQLTSKPTILIVEDNRSLRDYLRLLLQDNYNILTAENGLVALDLLSTQHLSPSVSLIISDIMMPVMDGFQLLEVLKNRPYFQQIPVIMLTARAEIQDKLKALRIGVDDYLLKPFEEEELSTRVANLLRNYKNRNDIPQIIEEKSLEIIDNQEVTEPIADYRQTPDALIWLSELEQVVAKSMTQFDFTTEGVAEKMFMGRSQFFKKVKQLTGITPNEYVQEMRLSQARILLENRRCSTVKEAAFSVGFKDVRYFSELFRKRFGKLPSDYLN